MHFRVLRPFTANGRQLNRGDVVEFEPSARTQVLIDTRYMLPTDPAVVEQSAPAPSHPEVRQRRQSKTL